MKLESISVELLTEMIRGYAKATGIKASEVARDPFYAAHKGRVGVVDEFRALWSLAKSMASDGSAPAPPVEPVPVGHRVKGVSTYVDGDGVVKGQWIKTDDKADPEAAILRMMAELPAKVAPRSGRIEAPAPAPDSLLAVYPLGDPHVGMLAWGEESGADFDLAICESLMAAAMRDLVLRGPRTHEALVVNLGDFLHYDNANSRTTRGEHSLDTDSRAPKVLAVAMRILVALVDAALEHHRVVTVDNRIGNHDSHTSLMLSLALGAYYRNEPRVSVPPTVRHRAYYERGSVLIGTTHGDRAKPDDLAAIMAAEQPAAWGRTKHRYWLTGHIHHQTRKEHRGCVVESFRTLAAADSWHAAQGYISGRDMHRIVYDTRHGEVSREIVNVGALLAEVRP